MADRSVGARNKAHESETMRAKLQFHSPPFMGKDIVPTDTAKDLVVILDSNLTYDEHIIETLLRACPASAK